MRYSVFQISLLTLLIHVLLSCKPTMDDNAGTVFRYNEAANITSLDPVYARDQANIWACHQLFDGLVQLNSKLEVIPSIATSWDISVDGTEYTFHLRQDVYFHDNKVFRFNKGRKVTAHDVVFSLNRLIDPRVASPGAWVVQNVSRMHDSLALFALNDSTLKIVLSQPFPPFLGLLSTMYCSVVPPEAVHYYGVDFRKNPIGTGPFQFKLWKEGIKLVFVKNPHYFEFENGSRLPFLDAVSISFLSDKQSAFLEFIKGRLDFISGIDASYKDELLTRNGDLNPRYKDRLQLISIPYLNTEYFGFMIDPEKDKGAALKKEVRQAINYSFDREKMITYLRNNIGIPGFGGIQPRGLPSYDSTRRYFNYDPAKAKNLLKKAGYTSGDKKLEVSLSTTSDYLDIAKYLQHQAGEIGIHISIEVLPPASLKELKAQCKLPFFRASWIADYPDGENYLSLFYSPNFTPQGPNYTHFKNNTYDSLYRIAMKTVNDSLRYTRYREMEQLLMEEAPIVVLYYDQVLRFIHKGITGMEGDPMNLLTLKRVKKL